MPGCDEIADYVLAGGEIGRGEALWLTTEAGLEELLFHANRLRERAFGNTVQLCSIINAKSGACSEDCKFCAQSARHKTGVEVYPLVEEERIVAAAESAAANGADCFGIVTSAESACGNRRDFEAICAAVRKIAECAAAQKADQDAAGCKVGECAAAQKAGGKAAVRPSVSIGKLGAEDVARLKEAGVRRVHHNLETSERFFPQICTTHSWSERVETVEAVKAAGLEVCCGGLFGLGETWEDRVDLALELRRLGVDSVPVNFLSPIPGTPLAGRPLLRPREALRIVALFRFVLPTKEIKVCGGRGMTLRDLQSWMFFAGASGTMVGNYLTTKGRAAEDDLQMMADLGLVPTSGTEIRNKSEVQNPKSETNPKSK